MSIYLVKFILLLISIRYASSVLVKIFFKNTPVYSHELLLMSAAISGFITLQFLLPR